MAQRRNRDDDQDDRRGNNGNGNGNGKKGPEQSFKIGAAGGGFIEVACWSKEIGEGKKKFTAWSVSIQRSYMDDKDEWQTTNFLRQDHCPVAIYLLQRAWEWILTEKAEGHALD